MILMVWKLTTNDLWCYIYAEGVIIIPENTAIDTQPLNWPALLT